MERPLTTAWPRLVSRLPLAELGELPTPIEDLSAVMKAAGAPGYPAWVKRDDLTSPVYGGNKVRTLEVLFGAAKARGCTHIYSTGAYGSNHAAATVLHAPRVGLSPGIVLFPQPPSKTAAENLRVMLSRTRDVVSLPHWSALPFGMRRAHARCAGRAEVMVPGGATPRGGLGYVSAALEVAHQVEDGVMPRPTAVVVGVGSTCTSAGLLVGFHHAARMGIGFVDAAGRPAPPRVVSVRVTPWPVTAAFRIARLAQRVSEELADLADDPALALGYAELHRSLEVDGRWLGRGYGRVTPAGRSAIEAFAAHPIALDTTYSAKAAAAAIDRARRALPGPLLFWSTKSTSELPVVDEDALADAPGLMRRFLRKPQP